MREKTEKFFVFAPPPFFALHLFFCRPAFFRHPSSYLYFPPGPPSPRFGRYALHRYLIALLIFAPF